MLPTVFHSPIWNHEVDGEALENLALKEHWKAGTVYMISEPVSSSHLSSLMKGIQSLTDVYSFHG